ncbi:hypothetical protein JMJ35_005455 [Cladonia borealis]|uniref:Heterokaryon incompatibility domain-containing protein n=1 Tax=Cladonia borealis TaxID=184061 RepID=A0AA39QZV4_9LECA|nr:hypothetical protein JMJ35_005455 [Cladonia borealis]
MPYQYDPLDHQVGSLRLVMIQPSPNRSANFECILTHDNLGKAQYSDLSYTWGSPDNKQIISLDGRPFEVTKNLFVALKDLRHEDKPLTVWIDAICINQEDVNERTAQVSQMVEIYKKATNHFIWMGEEIEGLDAAISLMHRLKQCMDKGGFSVEGLAGARYPLDRQSLKAVLLGVRASEATDARDKVFAILGLSQSNLRLCEVDYWRSVSQIYVEATVKIWRETGSLHFLSWTHNNADRGGYLSRPEDLPSWALSWIGSQDVLLELQCFDDLMSPMHRSLAGQEIIEAAAKSTSKTSALDDIANRAYYINTKSVSNWMALLEGSDPEAEQQVPSNRPKRSIYATTQNSQHHATCNGEKGTLTVLGFAIDVLEDVSPPINNGPSFPIDSPASSWIRTVFNRKLGLPVSTSTEDSDSDSDDEASISCQVHPTCWRVLLVDQWQGVRFGEEVSIPGVGSIPPRSIKQLFAMRGAVTSTENQVAFRWRRLFTSRKTVGLVPPVARNGDIVFAMLGCDVPYLIRKCDNGYRFVGER